MATPRRSTPTTPFIEAAAAGVPKPPNAGNTIPSDRLSTRRTRMMEVANLYIHQADSEQQRKDYLGCLKQLKSQFESVMGHYKECQQARISGKKIMCSDEAWDMVIRKVTGKGTSLRKVLEVKLTAFHKFTPNSHTDSEQ